MSPHGDVSCRGQAPLLLSLKVGRWRFTALTSPVLKIPYLLMRKSGRSALHSASPEIIQVFENTLKSLKLESPLRSVDALGKINNNNFNYN